MQVNPDCQFDSFVTMGLEGPALVVGALSTVGIDFDSWTETQGLTTTNGAHNRFRSPAHRFLNLLLLLQARSSLWTRIMAQRRTARTLSSCCS